MENTRLWQLVLDDLQVSISRGIFSTWFKQTDLSRITEVDGGRQIAEIACPSSFHQQILETRYYAQIKEAFDRLTKKKTELTWLINPALKTTKTTDAPLFASLNRPTFDDFQIAQQRAGLNEDFTLETFAVSSSNEMAYAAALAVSNDMGKAYNPLFLYGGVGVGKTHLMQSIANNSLKKDAGLAIVYCAGEEFTNEIIDAIQQKKTRDFRKRYREARGLFIDDIQFIAGKNTVQEEFFHTFNAVLKTGGQIVLTSDRPPFEINNLEDRLRSRFEGGLLIDIGEPSFELRTAILLIKAKQRNVNLSMEAAQAVAANIQSTRRLEGFLVRLIQESKTKNQPMSLEMVQSLLGTRLEASQIKPLLVRPNELLKRVADYFQVNLKDLRGPLRARPVVEPRQLAMYLLRVDMDLPLTEIGNLFGGRDHTTVMHSVEKITNELVASESLRTDVANLRKSLQV